MTSATTPSNLFADVARDLTKEQVVKLLETAGLRIERIVSHGHVSPPGFWYDSESSEWVMVLSGLARLEFEDRKLEMRPGDWVNIPAHVKHRVEWTSPDEPTIWLAVHY